MSSATCLFYCEQDELYEPYEQDERQKCISKCIRVRVMHCLSLHPPRGEPAGQLTTRFNAADPGASNDPVDCANPIGSRFWQPATKDVFRRRLTAERIS